MREKVYFMDFVEKEFTDIETLLNVFRKNTGFQNLSLEQCFNKSIQDDNIRDIFNYLITWANEYRSFGLKRSEDLQNIHNRWVKLTQPNNGEYPKIYFGNRPKKLKINFN